MSTQRLHYNTQTRLQELIGQPQAMLVVQPGDIHGQAGLGVYQLLHLFTQPAPGLFSPLSLRCISLLVDTLISLLSVLLCNRLPLLVNLLLCAAHLQPSLTH